MNRFIRGSAALLAGLLAMSSSAMAGNGALLDVVTGYPDITYVSATAAGGAVYTTGASGSLIITATATSVTFTPTGNAEPIAGGGLSLTAKINSAGTFNPTGSTFTISGTVVDTKGTPAAGDDVSYTGTLLSGTVTDYGIINISTTDLADFKLKATGGSLLAKVGGANAVVGMTTTLEDSTFAGSFATNWSSATAKGNVGPGPTKQPFPCYNVSDVSIKNRSGTTNDEAHVNKSGVRLPTGVYFNPAADDVTVAIDGLVTTIPAGSFVQNGTKQDFTYNTASGVTPKIQMRLNFEKATWEFDLTKGDVALATTADGVDVSLTVGIYMGTQHVVLTNSGHSSDSSQTSQPSCKPDGTGSDSASPGSNKLSSIAALTLRTPSGTYSGKTRSAAGISHPNTAYVDDVTGELAIVNTSGGECLQCGQVVSGTNGGAFTIMKIKGRPNDTLARKCGVYNASCDILPPGM
jgi:hypothetical protein